MASPVWTRFANRPRESLDLLPIAVDVLDLAQVRPGRELALQLGELVLGLALLDRPVDGRDRLLPGEGQRRRPPAPPGRR